MCKSLIDVQNDVLSMWSSKILGPNGPIQTRVHVKNQLKIYSQNQSSSKTHGVSRRIRIKIIIKITNHGVVPLNIQH